MTDENFSRILAAIDRIRLAFSSRTIDYVEALSRFPVEDVEVVIERVIRGAEAEHDGRSCPPPNVLARLIDGAIEAREQAVASAVLADRLGIYIDDAAVIRIGDLVSDCATKILEVRRANDGRLTAIGVQESFDAAIADVFARELGICDEK